MVQHSPEVVVARQPIFNADLLVVGYELLFRDSVGAGSVGAGTTVAAHAGLVHGGPATIAAGDCDTDVDEVRDRRTATVLASALSVGLDRLVGDKDIFCNAGREVLSGAVPLLLPPDRTTIEVIDVTEYDVEIEDGCRRLRRAGYGVALDGFTWFTDAERLLQHASVVKLDVQALGVQRACELAERCREFGLARVAHKVETAAELEQCGHYAFEMLQGYALARPLEIRGTGLDASTLGVMQLAAAVLDEGTDIAEVERIVRRDPGLTVQLLEVASIPPLGELRRTVRSIRQALVLLGTQRLRSWVMLLMLRSSRPMPTDELVGVLARARMCELLADGRDAPFAFTAGMVSALDRLLGLPAEELATALPLDDELLAAAFAGTTPVGTLVRAVTEFEAGGPGDAAMHAVSARSLDWAVQSAELLEVN